jgi:hypothetical protein
MTDNLILGGVEPHRPSARIGRFMSSVFLTRRDPFFRDQARLRR